MITAKLKINHDDPPRVYNRMIFGHFIEHFHRQVYGGIFDPGNPLSDEQGFRKDVIETLKELKVPIVRWPGGCFASAYHWQNGVGKTRTPSWDKAWGVEDPNTFGTDEFVTWCRKIGAKPYICTNAGTGTQEEMSDWVEYCNLKNEGYFAKLRISNGYPDPHRVKYWSIGNENWGGHEMGAKTVEEWGPFVREAAKLMSNVDSRLRLSAAALSNKNWTLPLLKLAGNHLNYISIHGYWDPLWQSNVPLNYMACMYLTLKPEKQIQETIALLKKAKCDDRIHIAFDEWNLRGWHHPGHGIRFSKSSIKARDLNDLNETYTMADALFSACFLNSCLRHAEHVKMACIAPGVNARGPLHVHPEGIVKRTTYHVLWMYATILQSNIMPCEVNAEKLPILKSEVTSKGPDVASVAESLPILKPVIESLPVLKSSKMSKVPVVDAVATTDPEGTILTFALVNKHPNQAVECDLGIPNLPDEVEGMILEGDSTDAFNDIEHPDRVVPENRRFPINQGSIRLPPHSLVFFNVKK